MKLKKGKHKVELLLNETSKFTCENMFKGCKDISSILSPLIAMIIWKICLTDALPFYP